MLPADDERLATELSLLEAMYPEQINWDAGARELKFAGENRSFQLRLPDGYLNDALPLVLSATLHRNDAREDLKRYVQACAPGEEILDSVVSAFNDMSNTAAKADSATDPSQGAAPGENAQQQNKATVIVWLHHLLNTNKRKQALSPESPNVCGVTKPGYPGVLVYSGPAEAVFEQVNGLKQLNWQAFQIRLETAEEWTFTHGSGVKEVESMKDVVAEVGIDRKEAFMEAVMRVK